MDEERLQHLLQRTLQGDGQAALEYYYLTSEAWPVETVSNLDIVTPLGEASIYFQEVDCYFDHDVYQLKCPKCKGKRTPRPRREVCYECDDEGGWECPYDSDDGCDECDFGSWHDCEECKGGTKKKRKVKRQVCSRCKGERRLSCPACKDGPSHPRMLLIRIEADYWTVKRRKVRVEAECFFSPETHSFVKIVDFLKTHWGPGLIQQYARFHGISLSKKVFQIKTSSKLTPAQKGQITKIVKQTAAHILVDPLFSAYLFNWYQRERIEQLTDNEYILATATKRLAPTDKRLRKVVAKALKRQGITPSRAMIEDRYQDILSSVPQLQHLPDCESRELGNINAMSTFGSVGLRLKCACNGKTRLEIELCSGQSFPMQNKGTKHYLVNSDGGIHSSWSRIDHAKRAKRNLKKEFGITAILVARPKGEEGDFQTAIRGQRHNVWIEPGDEDEWITSYNIPWIVYGAIEESSYNVSAVIPYKDRNNPKEWRLVVTRSDDPDNRAPYPNDIRMIKGSIRSLLADLWEFEEFQTAQNLCRITILERLAMKTKIYLNRATTSERLLTQLLITYYRERDAFVQSMRNEMERQTFVPSVEEKEEKYRRVDLSEDAPEDPYEEGPSERLLAVIHDVFDAPEETEDERLERLEALRIEREAHPGHFPEEGRVRRIQID